MRLRRSTGWAVGTLTALWTVMLLFVSIQLFLHASNVLTVVENTDKQFEAVASLLRESARYEGQNSSEFSRNIEQAILQLTAVTPQSRTDAQRAVLAEGRRW